MIYEDLHARALRDVVYTEQWISDCRKGGVTKAQCEKFLEVAFEYAITTTRPNSEVMKEVMQKFKDMVTIGLIKTDAPMKEVFSEFKLLS